MSFDIDIIKSFYQSLPEKIDEIRKYLGRPLTLSEKILYSHLAEKSHITRINRGSDYADFAPDRIAMQDATAQMALLQFIVTEKERVSVPSSVHCDHLITGRSGAESDLKSALEINREVYEFLSSACSKYDIGFWKPGAGIIHQVILENYAFPGGLMIGTDSHTPTAGGLGMLAIGVGGADAVDVMTGMSWELKFPGLIGVKLTGKLNGWSSAKDIILKLTGMLTVKGGTGSIIEYFGEGAESLSCTGKATICNMGAETGATCSVFSFDKSMSDYLSSTDRMEVAELACSHRDHLTGDHEVYANPALYFDKYYEINLSSLEPYINGPFTPDRAIPISQMKREAEKHGWPVKVDAGLIGSCTNSSYEDISRAASVVKNALSEKLSLRSEFIIIPGSERIKAIAEDAGFMDLFRKAGGKIFANACGPCIGQWNRNDSNNTRINTIIHSFNRNFSKRADGNPNTHAFVASPEIVTAISVAGDLTFNPMEDLLINSDGEKMKLTEPEGQALPQHDFNELINGYQKPSFDKTKVEIKISPGSERLQLIRPFNEFNEPDFHNMPVLIKVKGKCTTDHISMAGVWLKYRGHLENISDNYMIGAINYFNEKTDSVLNLLSGKYEPVPQVARCYRDNGFGSIVIGEDNFGEGSSREHAAMEPRFLGVKAILAKSFARIHETNLKKQGVLIMTFAYSADYEKIREDDRIDIIGLERFSHGSQLNVRLNHKDGTDEEFHVDHSYNKKQILWLKAGSALNIIRKNHKHNG
ncbi:MAG: aconitate hydratase [Bacteroidales bacterium]|nr:aconitate hydratase [Bacteroidales bacterium]